MFVFSLLSSCLYSLLESQDKDHCRTGIRPQKECRQAALCSQLELMEQIRRNLIFQHLKSKLIIPMTTSNAKCQAFVFWGGYLNWPLIYFTCQTRSKVSRRSIWVHSIHDHHFKTQRGSCLTHPSLKHKLDHWLTALTNMRKDGDHVKEHILCFKILKLPNAELLHTDWKK